MPSRINGDPTTTNVWQAYGSLDNLADRLIELEGGSAPGTNNPGNLKAPGGGFQTFGSREQGRQALIDQLTRWQQQYPDWTVADLNRRYAPDKSHGGDNPDGTEAGRNQRMLENLSDAAGSPAQGRNLTISEFADQIRSMIPELRQVAPISDEDLVRQILKRRPDLITRMTTGPSRFPEPAEQELTPGEQIGKLGLAGGSVLGNLLLGAGKRSARELLTGGPGEGGQLAPVQLPPQEEAGMQQFETRHPTASNLGGALTNFIGGIPGAKTAARGMQQAITPTGTAQQVGSYIPDVVSIAPILRDLPGITRGAYRVAQGARFNPFTWPFKTALRNVAESVAPEYFRTQLQRAAGAGPGAVDLEVKAIQDANLEALGKHETNVANKTRLYDEAMKKYQQEDLPEAKRENLKNLRQAQQEHTEAQRAHSVAQHQAARIARDQQSIATRTQAYVNRAMNNLYRTYRVGEGDFNYRWADLRNTIRTRLGGPKGTPYSGALDSNLIKSVIDRETEKLFGSPENVQAFRQLTNFMTSEGGEATIGIDQPGKPGSLLRDLDFDQGLHYHGVIDRAIRSEGTSPPVRNALETLQKEALEPELSRTAERARVGRTYRELNRDYSQWKTDWSDPGPVTTGASPLRDAAERKDPLTFLQDVTKGTGEAVEGPGHRMVRDFAKYKKYGADPDLLTGIQNLTQQARDLKGVKIPEPPGMFKPPTPKELPTPPKFPEVKAPSFRVPRPEQFREERITRYANRPFSGRELLMVRGHPQRTLRDWLSDPAFRARVARGGKDLPEGYVPLTQEFRDWWQSRFR